MRETAVAFHTASSWVIRPTLWPDCRLRFGRFTSPSTPADRWLRAVPMHFLLQVVVAGYLVDAINVGTIILSPRKPFRDHGAMISEPGRCRRR